MIPTPHTAHDFFGSRRRLFRLWVLTVCCLLLTACTNASAVPTEIPQGLEGVSDGCRIKIGNITSLTGEYQNRAVELVQGYDMARDDINAAGGLLNCQLDLVYRDDASLSTQAVAGMRELVETEQVLLVVGSFASVITLDLGPLSSQYQIPLLAHNSTNFLITDLRYKWIFRTMPSSWNSMDQLLRYTSQLPLGDLPSVALLYEDSAYGPDIYVSLLSRLKTYSLSLVSAQPIPSGADNYEPLLQRMRESGADVLFLAGNSVSDGLRLMEQMKALDLNFKAYLTNGGAFTSVEFTQSPYANYFLAPVPWVSTTLLNDELSSQTTQEFIAHFKERYGTEPGYRTVNAYTNIYLAKVAIENALPMNEGRSIADIRHAIRDELQSLDVQETLFGPIRFNEFGQNTAQILLTQRLDGQFIVLDPDPETASDVIVPAPDWRKRETP